MQVKRFGKIKVKLRTVCDRGSLGCSVSLNRIVVAALAAKIERVQLGGRPFRNGRLPPQCTADRLGDKVVDATLIGESDLTLGWMHVDVQRARSDPNAERKPGLDTPGEQATVPVLDRGDQASVTYQPVVDDKEMGCAFTREVGPAHIAEAGNPLFGYVDERRLFRQPYSE